MSSMVQRLARRPRKWARRPSAAWASSACFARTSIATTTMIGSSIRPPWTAVYDVGIAAVPSSWRSEKVQPLLSTRARRHPRQCTTRHGTKRRPMRFVQRTTLGSRSHSRTRSLRAENAMSLCSTSQSGSRCGSEQRLYEPVTAARRREPCRHQPGRLRRRTGRPAQHVRADKREPCGRAPVCEFAGDRLSIANGRCWNTKESHGSFGANTSRRIECTSDAIDSVTPIRGCIHHSRSIRFTLHPATSKPQDMVRIPSSCAAHADLC